VEEAEENPLGLDPDFTTRPVSVVIGFIDE
jgi:hypothetical protein